MQVNDTSAETKYSISFKVEQDLCLRTIRNRMWICGQEMWLSFRKACGIA